MITQTAPRKAGKKSNTPKVALSKPTPNGKGLLPVSTTISDPAWEHVSRVASDDDRTFCGQLRKIVHDWHDGTRERPSSRN